MTVSNGTSVSFDASVAHDAIGGSGVTLTLSGGGIGGTLVPISNYSAALAATLAAQTNKTNWCAEFIDALSTARTITIKHTADVHNADVWANGTTVLQADLSGSMTATSGVITNIGYISNVTTLVNTDLSAGASILRISSGTEWFQAHINITGTPFIIDNALSTSNGVGFTNSISIASPAALPMYDISIVDVEFGAAGASAPITLVEQVYTDMPIGFGSVTQTRHRSAAITVSGIQFTLFPAIDSNGRVDVWVYAAWKAAANTSDTAVNRERASVELKISIGGVAQNLFGAGTTFAYTHQRATWLRWQSSTMTWDFSNSYISSLITAGTFLKHDSRNAIGALENQSTTNLPSTAAYVPFSTFADIAQLTKVGTQLRSTPAGGERVDIGPCHEYIARLISEVGTNNNVAWLTATRQQIIKDLAETAAQFPIASGLLDHSTYRLLDPSQQPYCCHDNTAAWFSATGIPQPGTLGVSTGNTSEQPYDGRFDQAHPFNKFSFHAYHLTKDPFHLFLTQAQAIAVLAFNTLNEDARGVDGRISRVTIQEERGFWWSLQILIHAWHATPSGTMPKPFLSKTFFATAIDNTLQYIRDGVINSVSPVYSGVTDLAAKYWRAVSPFDLSTTGKGRISISGTTMTVSALTAGSFGIGQTITGSNITAGTKITALGTGNGGTGTYTINNSQTLVEKNVTITAASLINSTVTVTANAHGFVNGENAFISGITPSYFNGTFVVTNASANSFDYVVSAFSSTTVNGSGATMRAATTATGTNTAVSMSAFMCDYGHIVCCEGLLLGYTNLRDVAEWHAVNAELRASMAGNWYLCDPVTSLGNGLLAQALVPSSDSVLPYSDLAGYKSWYPRKGTSISYYDGNSATVKTLTGYIDGTVASPAWIVDAGRDTYMWLGVLNLYKEVANRGLITIGFDAAAARADMLTNHPSPYTVDGTGGTLPWNYVIWAKQYFSY